MIAKTWMKWTAGATVAVALAALPAIGQARAHYTGVAPAKVSATTATPVKLTTVRHASKKPTKLAVIHKHKLKAKHVPASKLHSHKLKHHALSTKPKKA